MFHDVTDLHQSQGDTEKEKGIGVWVAFLSVAFHFFILSTFSIMSIYFFASQKKKIYKIGIETWIFTDICEDGWC